MRSREQQAGLSAMLQGAVCGSRGHADSKQGHSGRVWTLSPSSYKGQMSSSRLHRSAETAAGSTGSSRSSKNLELGLDGNSRGSGIRNDLDIASTISLTRGSGCNGTRFDPVVALAH